MTKPNHNIHKEFSMKKTLLVTALAVALVLVFAGSAFAGYLAWTTAAPFTANAANGPHNDYQTTTGKCSVCHAVHGAASIGTTGTDVGVAGVGNVSWTASGTNTEMLLRSSVAASCNYCHVDTSIGGVQIYQASANPADGSLDTATFGFKSPSGHNLASGCTRCHSVHGAMTYQGANAAKILKLQPQGSNPQPEILGTSNPSGSGVVPLFVDQASATGSSVKYAQQTVFCSSCHAEFTTSPDATMSTVGHGQVIPGKNHAMVGISTNFGPTTAGPATTYQNAADTVGVVTAATNASGASAIGDQVAWAASTSCRACHDAGQVNQTGASYNSFPHYVAGTQYLLLGAANHSGKNDSVASGTNANGGAAPVTTNGVVSPYADAACLKCHRNDNSTSGVGITF